MNTVAKLYRREVLGQKNRNDLCPKRQIILLLYLFVVYK